MRSPFYLFIQAASALLFRTFYDYRVHGAEHVPDGGCIIAANHDSFFDPPLIGCTLESAPHYLARKTLFDHPLFATAIANLNAHPIDQERPDMAGLKRVIGVAKKGAGVVLFPEGSRSWDGQLQPAQPGIGLVVAKARVPVVPARIFGAHPAWPRGRKPTPFHPIRVVFGPPIQFTEIPGDRDAYQSIGNQIMQAIAALPCPGD
ncbi:MAG: lysophospholipid acyltransferase family protein [Candidatus Methylacidiphilales bacterium]|nr:lysophospholipid acyltransferase family protein [Candidatus Methylacidiphilales bacterium]